MRSAAMAVAALCIALTGPVADARSPRRTPAVPPTSAAPTPVTPAAPVRPLLVRADIVARFPHDAAAFTQGLIVEGNILHESVGQEGRSGIRRVDLVTGAVQAMTPIPPQQFGEGLARMGDRLFSLTWLDGVAHVWNMASLRATGTLRYSGEGWGLAAVGSQLAMSDGSANIVFRDPATFAEVRRVQVTSAGRPVRQLNELEMVDGRLLANVWHTPYIVAIDPATGVVTHVIDCRALVDEVNADNREAVLNGIAFDPATRRLFVTGKLWPTLYEIRVPDLR